MLEKVRKGKDYLRVSNSQVQLSINDLKASVSALKETFISYCHKAEISENKSQNLRETDSRVVVTRAWGWGKREDMGQRVKLLVIRLTNSGDLIYSMMIIANNIVL